MLEITIKDTETNSVMHRTTELVAICVKTDDGTLGMTLGQGKPTTIANFALALDRIVDNLLDDSKASAMLYHTAKQACSCIKTKDLAIDSFSDR